MMNKYGLLAATQCPKVPFDMMLAAQLVMGGFKIIPEDLWEAVADKLDQINTDDSDDVPELDQIKVKGLLFESNDANIQSHDMWVGCYLVERYKPGTWVIPCDELLEAKFGPGYCDFIYVSRFMCGGTEQEMREAVNRFLES